MADAVSAFVAKHARDINTLSDADRNKRRRAIQTLTASLTGDERTATAALPVEVIRGVMDSALAKPIVSLIADSSESNREAAIQLIAKVLHEDHGKGKRLHASLFPLLLPAMSGRVGKYPYAEDSEELRLQLAQLLNVLLAAGEEAGSAAEGGSGAPSSSSPSSASCKGLIKLHLKDLVDLLRAMANDAFPSVKAEISTSVLHLVGVLSSPSSAAPSNELCFHVAPLVTAFSPSLSHQRAAVRLSTLEAISALVSSGCNGDDDASSGGEGLERLLNETLLPVLKQHVRFDRMPSVRKQLAVSLGSWLTLLPWSALGGKVEGTCLAMLLGLVADEEAPEVAAQAYSSLEAAAEARFKKSKSSKSSASKASSSSSSSLPRDLSIAADAASIDAVAAMSVAGGGILRSAEDAEGQDGGDDGDDDSSAAVVVAVDTHLPHGGRRANPAVVRFVGKRLHNTLPILLDELKDWTDKARIFSAGGLRSLLAAAESFVTPHLSAVIAALCTGSRDEEAIVRKLLNQAGGLLGAFVPAEEQLAVLLPQLRGEISGLNNAQHYTAALKVLAAAVGGGGSGSGMMSTAAILPHLQPLVAALASPKLVEEEAPGLRRALVSAVSAVLGSLLQGDQSSITEGGEEGTSMAVDSSSGGASAVFEASTEVQKRRGARADGRGSRLVRAMSRAMVFDDEEDLTGSAGGIIPSSSSFSASSAAGTTPGGYFSSRGISSVTDEVRRALSDRSVLEPLLLLLLYLHEATTSASTASSLAAGDAAAIAAAEDIVICMASDCVHAVSRALKFQHSADLYAAFAQRLLAIILADCNLWAVRNAAGTGSATAVFHRRLFDSLLRAARPALSGTSWDECRSCVESCVDAFAMCLSPSKDPELRVVTLALLDAFIIGAADPEADLTIITAGGDGESHTNAGARTAYLLSGEATTSAAARDHKMSPEGGAGVASSSSSFASSSLHHHHHHHLTASPSAAPTAAETVPASAATQHHVREALSRMDVVPSSSSSSSSSLSSSSAAVSSLAARVGADADRSALMAVDDAADDATIAALANSSGGGRGHASDLVVDMALRRGAAARLVKEALLPNIVWRAGGVSSTIRKVSVACFYSACRRGLLSASSLHEILSEVLPILKGCLSDDDPATRLLCTQSISCVLRVLKDRFDGESLRLLYVELLKRLDDSNDAVRIAACDCLRDLAKAVVDPSDVRHGPTEHCVDALLVHCDDTDPRVQLAAYEATLSWGKLQPAYLRKQALLAKDKHRNPARANALVAAAEGFIATETAP